jgi:prepilin peptidase CpaA
MISYLILSIAPAAWIVAALNDVQRFKIPNWIHLFLLLSFPPSALYLGYTPAMWMECLMLSVGVLVFGFALFAFGKIGAGDVKLIVASAPWVGVAAFPIYLMKIVLLGGLFSLLMLRFRSMPYVPDFARAEWVVRLHTTERKIPYGVPIAAGGLWAVSDMQVFSLIFG